jgi:hypothetical protein
MNADQNFRKKCLSVVFLPSPGYLGLAVSHICKPARSEEAVEHEGLWCTLEPDKAGKPKLDPPNDDSSAGNLATFVLPTRQLPHSGQILRFFGILGEGRGPRLCSHTQKFLQAKVVRRLSAYVHLHGIPS